MVKLWSRSHNSTIAQLAPIHSLEVTWIGRGFISGKDFSVPLLSVIHKARLRPPSGERHLEPRVVVSSVLFCGSQSSQDRGVIIFIA